MDSLLGIQISMYMERKEGRKEELKIERKGERKRKAELPDRNDRNFSLFQPGKLGQSCPPETGTFQFCLQPPCWIYH